MLVFCKCKRRGSVNETRAKACEPEPDAKNTLKHLPMDHCINIITCQWARNSTRPIAKLLFDSNSSRLNADLRKYTPLKQIQHFQKAGSPRIHPRIDPTILKTCTPLNQNQHFQNAGSPRIPPRIDTEAMAVTTIHHHHDHWGWIGEKGL